MYRMLDSIVDHRTDGSEALQQWRYNTRGHDPKRQWNDGTHSWIPLKDLKESYPIETAEYAVSMLLTESPAFKWWVPFTMRRRDRIISRVNHRLIKKKFKYGYEVPNGVE